MTGTWHGGSVKGKDQGAIFRIVCEISDICCMGLEEVSLAVYQFC